MAKITSKLQVTIPKALAERFGLKPGDEVEWVASGRDIRLVPKTAGLHQRLNAKDRLWVFDQATERLKARELELGVTPATSQERDWTREELYDRGSAG